MNREQMVKHACRECGECLHSPASEAGEYRGCTWCGSEVKIPNKSNVPATLVADYPIALPAPKTKKQKERSTVPMKLSLPGKMGSMEASVSQGTANSMAKVATGGFLVALGVIVAALCGVRPPRA